MKAALFKTMFIFFGALVLLSYWSAFGELSDPNLDPNESSLGHNRPMATKDRLCAVNLTDSHRHFADSSLPLIYFVTPTYPRPEQMPELTRLSHTLMHVPRLHWIVADDQYACSDQVLKILSRSGLPYTLLSSPKPRNLKGPSIPRGVSNRRAALSWLRSHTTSGVLYFGDDDNTLDLRLFDEIRRTKKVSMFPVGLIGYYGVSSPVVKDGKVVGFFDSWPASRTFPVDMAGFAVNLQFLTPASSMPYIAGYEEDKFLLSLGLKLEDIEPLAEDCSKVLVWHTRTVKCKKPTLKVNLDKLSSSHEYDGFVELLNETSRIGMTTLDPQNGLKTYISRNRKIFNTIEGLQ